MHPRDFHRAGDFRWSRAPKPPERVPVVVHAGPRLFDLLEPSVRHQAQRISTLPGIVDAVHLLPNASRSQGFPIGCVAAFDAAKGGVRVPAGVGFDPWGGIRVLASPFQAAELAPRMAAFADALAERLLKGAGGGGAIELSDEKIRDMLVGGVPWAIEHGWGETEDLLTLEDAGRVEGASTGMLSVDALRRQRAEFGTLGGGEHGLEILEVATIVNAEACAQLGLVLGGVVVAIDAGSRGLGSQVVVDAVRAMVSGAAAYGLAPTERDLACAPGSSEPALRWSANLAAAANAAQANRQALTHLVRQVAARFMPAAHLRVVFDASRDTCRQEVLTMDGASRVLDVHRRGAVRLLGPGHPALPKSFARIGQPLLVRGGIGAWPVLAIAADGCEQIALASGPAGSGRVVGRQPAWEGDAGEMTKRLQSLGLTLRGLHPDALLPEIAEAFRSVDLVVEAARQDQLLRPVARLRPLACVHA